MLRAIIRGTQVTLPFFLTITLDQRICPSALHFGTLHKGDPRGQGMVSHRTALSLRSELSPGRGRFCRERKDWKLDSQAALTSLKFPFKETPHSSRIWEEKKASNLTSSWKGRAHSQLIPFVTRMLNFWVVLAGHPAPEQTGGGQQSQSPGAGLSPLHAQCSEDDTLFIWFLLLVRILPKHQQIFFSNRTPFHFRGKCRPVQRPTNGYKIPRDPSKPVSPESNKGLEDVK